MRIISVFFLLGTLSIQLFQDTPSLALIGLLLGISLLVVLINFVSKHSKYVIHFFATIVSAFIVAFFIAAFSVEKQSNARLQSALEGKDILVEGIIEDIPNIKIIKENNKEDNSFTKNSTRFRFTVERAFSVTNHEKLPVTGLIRLAWYKNPQKIVSGERWQFRVRLKQPSGFMNPGTFDYEKWLFTERIIATGYIRDSKANKLEQGVENKRLKESPWWSINALRQKVHETIQLTVANKASAAVVSALAVADRSQLSKEQWSMLQKTGTSHLVAISGLHIAIIAGFAFFPVFIIWKLFPRLNEKVPVLIASGITGIILASVYALLAGFTLPTQRALLMVIVALIGLMMRRYYPASYILAVALLAVLLLDPLAGMTISFWLSFLAVSIILIISKRHIGANKSRFQAVSSLLTLQFLLSLGMFPLSLLFFNSASISSPLANLFAIPWVSIVVVPLTLLGVLLIPLSSFLSAWLLNIAALTVDLLFKGLGFINRFDVFNVDLPKIPIALLLLAFLGFLFVLLPKGFPARWLGLIAIFPAVLFTPQKPKQGEFLFTLLDAGQGMASVLETENHTLIYDTGKKVSDNFDIGKLVLVPFLKSKGVKKVDRLIISHEDNDHRGGAQTVLASLSVNLIQTSDLTIIANYSVLPCKVGETWQWDGVNFEFLSPPIDWIKKFNQQSSGLIGNRPNQQIKDNDRSCVLRIYNDFHSLLLTGDIQSQAENYLLEQQRDKLSSEVMIIPHHGSRTSSSLELINTVNPKLALVPIGYRNRFGHPKEDILKRYTDKNITVLDTVKQGALILKFPAGEGEIKIQSWREMNKGFWSRKDY